MMQSYLMIQMTEDAMNYQSMQLQAREKHQDLRQEARRHRLARQADNSHDEPQTGLAPRRLAAAIAMFAGAAAAYLNN